MKKAVFLSLILGLTTQVFCTEQAPNNQRQATTQAPANQQPLFNINKDIENKLNGFLSSDENGYVANMLQDLKQHPEKEDLLQATLNDLLNDPDNASGLDQLDDNFDPSQFDQFPPMDPSIFDNLPGMDWKMKLMLKVMMLAPKFINVAKSVFAFIKANPTLLLASVGAILFGTLCTAGDIVFLALFAPIAAAICCLPVLSLPVITAIGIACLIGLIAITMISVAIAALGAATDTVLSLIFQVIPGLKTLQAKYGILKPDTVATRAIIGKIFPTIKAIFTRKNTTAPVTMPLATV